jgi:hypothetical protein
MGGLQVRHSCDNNHLDLTGNLTNQRLLWTHAQGITEPLDDPATASESPCLQGL